MSGATFGEFKSEEMQEVVHYNFGSIWWKSRRHLTRHLILINVEDTFVGIFEHVDS
jgi:hypothetical protein